MAAATDYLVKDLSQLFLQHGGLYLSGPAGVGKTFLIHAVLQEQQCGPKLHFETPAKWTGAFILQTQILQRVRSGGNASPRGRCSASHSPHVSQRCRQRHRHRACGLLTMRAPIHAELDDNVTRQCS